MVIPALLAVAALLALAPIALLLSRSPFGRPVAYGASLALALVLATAAAASLFGHHDSAITLPLGLPWLGAHFRIDALSAFFLIVVNVGAAAASLFAIGYGRHEEHPQRVLPFYPAYLAAMNLVLLSADAFSFLVSWEFMSLSSWALVIAHHHIRGEHARRLRLSVDGELRHAGAAVRLRPARRPGRRLRLRCNARGASLGGARGADPGAGAGRRRLESRSRAAARLAAARASGGAEPRLRADERRDDQGRRLRLHPHRLRSCRAARLVVEHAGSRASAPSPR